MSASVDPRQLAPKSRSQHSRRPALQPFRQLPWQPSWLRIREQRTIGVLLLGYLILLAGPLLFHAAAGRIHRVDQAQPSPRLMVDVNQAPLEELSLLPGIGPSLAARIIARREVTPFLYVEQLRDVQGIGPKTLDRLRDVVICAPPEETNAPTDRIPKG